MSMRIMGLGSGIDMEGIIEQLMSIERRPLLLMQQKQQVLEEQKNAWRDVNTRLKHLTDKFMPLKLDATYLSLKAASSDDKVVTATAKSNAEQGTYKIEVKQLATHTVQYGKEVEGGARAALGASGTIAIDEQWVIEVGEEDSLSDIVRKINALTHDQEGNEQAAPVRASIVNNQLVLTSKETGSESDFAVEFSVDNGDLAAALGPLSQVDGGGLDAQVTINGIDVETSSNTLKDVIPGVMLELQGLGSSTLNIEQDAQQVIDAVQAFIDQYNSALDFINSKLQAERESDPNSVRGTLSGDSTLMRLQSNLRSIVAGRVSDADGDYSSLADLGIGTAKFVAGVGDYSGKLTLDKAKLEGALKTDPMAVKDIFYKRTKVEGEETYEYSGAIYKLEEYLRDFTRAGDGILTEKDKTYDRQIKDLKEQVEKMEYRLELRQERLVAQFVALEKALASMQSQGNWFSSQINQINNMYTQPKK